MNENIGGLVNLGNTCYINSALQCILNITELKKYFLDEIFVKELNQDANELNIIINLYKLFLLKKKKINDINPINLIREIKICSIKDDISLNLLGNNQNDVQEFLLYLIDKLHNGLMKKVNMNIVGEVKNDLDKQALNAMKIWKTFFKDNYSYIVELFYSQISSSIFNMEDKLLSVNYDPNCFYTLTVNENTKNLYDCFDLYTKKETISELELYKYKDKYIQIKKEIKFWSTPKILIILLKRFNNDGNKINKNVDFPLEYLNLNKYCVGYKRQNNIFNLIGVCNHIGSLSGGHYYSYCKTDNKWFNFNDTEVNSLEESDIITNKAYCLFYRKN